MAPAINSNSNLPGSSSSISLSESPNDEINYDSDISEDDHAIAEGGEDEEYDDEEDDEEGEGDEEDEPDEGFAVEVNTLTGNTFNIMIHPSDTVEVLKTRIAFQEGISPADQNLLLDSSTGCNNAATVQELNIDRNSKLTLVTNCASGVPFKTAQVSDSGCEVMGRDGRGDQLSSTSPSYKLAPTIKRNYNGNVNGSSNNNQPKYSSSSSSSTSLRLPKILTTNSSYLDKHSNNNGQVESQQQEQQQRPSRLDEREWMKSLFNKVVHQNEEDEEDAAGGNEDVHEGYNDRAKIVIDIDSTTVGNAAVRLPGAPRLSTRYVGTKYAPEEDGSILVVQGDDGVILIIQKNTGQLLEESGASDSNNNRKSGGGNGYNNRKGDGDGRIGRMGRYTKNGFNSGTTSGMSESMSSSYRRNRYQQENKLVQEKIKENAVTLEKMRQVRGLMAQQKRERSGDGGEVISEEKKVAVKTLEFPRLLEGGGMKSLGVKGGGGAVGYRSNGGNVTRTGRSAKGGRIVRSINSSKMSLNRLIAEIYLQTKRKDRSAFQPGQPPYTDQQLLRYVQLKTAILQDEQKRNKMEPCSKCQLDEDWSFNEAACYLVPTVVMNRYKRLANGRNSKSLDKEEMDDEDLIKGPNLRRKSMIPVVLPSSKPSVHFERFNNQAGNNGGSSGSYIPRLILVNRVREAETGANRNNPSSVTTTTSSLSRRSSSSIAKANEAYRFSNSSSGDGEGNKEVDSKRYFSYGGIADDDGVEDEDEGICDTIIIRGHGGTREGGGNNARLYSGGRPTLKVYPKLYSTSFGYGRSSSRPGSSSKANAAKKGSVRCQACKKKVGIACRYQCRCGLTFCSTHRYPETHACTFDYKTEGRNKLRENNPVVVAPKIQEI